MNQSIPGLDVYNRAFGSTVAQLADQTDTPRDLLGVEPWWYPNPGWYWLVPTEDPESYDD